MGWVKHHRSGRLRDRGRGNRHTPRPVESSPTPLGSFYQSRAASMDCVPQSGSGWKVKQPAPQWSRRSFPSIRSILRCCSGQQPLLAAAPHQIKSKGRRCMARLCSRQITPSPSVHQVCGPEDREAGTRGRTPKQKAPSTGVELLPRCFLHCQPRTRLAVLSR